MSSVADYHSKANIAIKKKKKKRIRLWELKCNQHQDNFNKEQGTEWYIEGCHLC